MNLLPVVGGRSSNSPLSPKGHVQARKLGFHFLEEKFVKLYSSTDVHAIPLQIYS